MQFVNVEVFIKILLFFKELYVFKHWSRHYYTLTFYVFKLLSLNLILELV